MQLSPLQKLRLDYQPRLPEALKKIGQLQVQEDPLVHTVKPEIASLFPKTKELPPITLKEGTDNSQKPMRIGVVFSGGQAPGGHNVITGIFDALKEGFPGSSLYGFLGGPSGILEGKYKELKSEELDMYRNQGGFDLLGSGRTKIDKPEQFANVAEKMREMALDGLVIIGGDDSNTNAALLAEYFLANGIATTVVGVPKTIDGDLRGHGIEISFGFDTACKTYSATIGSLLIDALSAKKYYFFVKLMGRSASHVTMECARLTHPNLAFIGEEIFFKKMHLQDVVNEITNVVIERSNRKKQYGVILIPEGLIEFVVDVKILIEELNKLLASGTTEEKEIVDQLTDESRECFLSFPQEIRGQLLIGRDSHDNIQVSKIETERLLIAMVEEQLKKRGSSAKFNPQPIFCGYEGRSCLPTNFDANYCYALGFVAVGLISTKKTGYICSVTNLNKDPEHWKGAGIPMVSMMVIENRMGKSKPVIEKALVDLNGKIFQDFAKEREAWKFEDLYTNPGPIQF